MKSTRLLFVLLAVLLAGAIVQLVLSQPDKGKAAHKSDSPPQVSTGEEWALHEGGGEARPEAGDDPIDREQFEQLMEHDRGTRVEFGTEVAVDVPYRPGTVSKYRHVFTSSTKRRGEDARAAWRRSEGLTLTVLEPDGSGRPRVELKQDWFLYQVWAGPMSWEYDSRSPDEEKLALPHVAGVIRPMLAILETPLVFTLDKTGYAAEIEGVEEQRSLYREALELLGGTRVEAFLPTEEARLMEARGILFPPGLGGTMTAGQGRDYARREDTGMLTHATFDGELHVTHDDPDTFSVEVRDVETGLERLGGTRLPNGREIADVRVLPNGICDASWVWDRTAGRLRTARAHLEYEFWVSLVSGDPTGQNPYEPHFLQIEQLRTIDPIAEK